MSSSGTIIATPRSVAKTTNNNNNATSNLKDNPPKSLLHVNFNTDKEDLSERKKKYLTAKYGQHQMSLIKKRLRVEMWMYERIQFLYGTQDNSDEVEIDVDELLDLDDFKRRDWLRGKMLGARQSKEIVEEFIGELLEKAKTL